MSSAFVLPSSRCLILRHRTRSAFHNPVRCALSERVEPQRRANSSSNNSADLVIVVGKFDAMHVGHQALVREAAKYGAPTLLSFSGMAAALGWPPRAPVVAPVERDRILRDWGRACEQMVSWRSMQFSEVQNLTPEEFIGTVRDMGSRALVCGTDWRFGARAKGDVKLAGALCKQAGMECEVVPPVLHEGAPMSSTRVRDALACGDVELAEVLMGRPHRLVGYVYEVVSDQVRCREFVNEVVAPGSYRALIRVLGIAQPVRTSVTVEDDGVVTIYDANQVYCADCEVYIDFISRVR